MTTGTIEAPPSIGPFDPEVDDAHAIARTHLRIRRWQIRTGQNRFSDIYDSQRDLMGLECYYLQAGGNFFVRRDPDAQFRAIGFVGLRNEGEGVGRIQRLAVEPEHHRQGIGRALVGSAIGWATDNDFSTIRLNTSFGENAKHLYEEFGFEVVDATDTPTNWAMKLDLPAAAASATTTSA